MVLGGQRVKWVLPDPSHDVCAVGYALTVSGLGSLAMITG